MTQAILPTRLWGGGGDDRSQRRALEPPMLDIAGSAFDDAYELSNNRLGDGSTSQTALERRNIRHARAAAALAAHTCALFSLVCRTVTACVFVGKDKQTGALYACKLAERRAQRHNWTRLCQLLRHESNLLQEIGYHPNVVRWHGCYGSCSQLAIVMELVGGGDCQQLLQRHGALAEEVVQAMIRQLHAALRCAAQPISTKQNTADGDHHSGDHTPLFPLSLLTRLPPSSLSLFLSLRSRLHGMGILHRDVKLENLLCDTSTRPPRVKLCDFGHAVTKRDLPHDRQFYGTPGYAAPEVMQGPVWTPKADVWAMGVVMYALLANALPFECEEGWRRPADLSSRVWWRVSLEAKLLLQVREKCGSSVGEDDTPHTLYAVPFRTAPPISRLSL